jgi:DNA-binding GntR family transcriptional regulator
MSKNTKVRGRIGRPKGTGSQRVYEALRSRILTFEMAPGAVVDENSLVSEFGVSRTPVREALISLAKDGYIALLPNRGATVSPLDIEEIPELLESLELCLRVTTRWAALRRSADDIVAIRKYHQQWHDAARRDDYPAMSEANNSFHLAIARAAGNRHITKLYQGILPQYYRLSLAMLIRAKVTFTVGKYKNSFAEVDEDHEQLVRSIEQQDAELADKLAQHHAKLIGQRLVAYIQSFSEADLPLGGLGEITSLASAKKRRRKLPAS